MIEAHALFLAPVLTVCASPKGADSARLPGRATRTLCRG
ncbi:hypothetical protein BH11ARM2_BH11ARM2_26860 [soil metagenome]